MREKVSAALVAGHFIGTIRQGITMKRIFLTTVSLGVLGLVSPVLGADLPTAYTKAPVSPNYDWSGFYVGVFGGYGLGNHNVNDALGPSTPFGNSTANYGSEGGLGGIEAGINYQSGIYLIGIEADGFWSGMKGNDAGAVASGAFPITSVDADNLRWGGTLRARGGFTVDRWLMFFTGGWAYGDQVHTNTDPVNGIDQFTTHGNGLTAGAGIEYAMTNNLIAKVEYRYYNFNQFSRAGTPLTPNGQLPYTVDSTYSVITLGLDYKFGGGVVAKY
jgi:outer membrane immunogenic protein